jgi:8-oxo-dGTP pyrophosphatase MutT (NUDIX family)
MPIATQHILDTIAAYLAVYPDDAAGIAPITAALAEPRDVTSREEFAGHATAGAVLVRPDGQVLMVHHRVLDRWLCPGGHLEPEDEDFTAAAARELAEETGVNRADIEPVGSVPLHIEVHPIPANGGKGEPRHQHFDFRILFRAIRDTTLIPQTEEVLGVSWRPVDAIQDEALRDRVTRAVADLTASG